MFEHLSPHTHTHTAFKHYGEFLDRVQLFMKSVYTCNEFNLPVGEFGLFKNCLQRRQSQRGLMCVCVWVWVSVSVRVCVSEHAPTHLQW